MKALKIAFVAAGIVLSLSTYSQRDTTRPDTTRPGTVIPEEITEDPNMNTMKADKISVQGMNSSQPLPKPNFGRYYIPVLGTYTSSNENTEPGKNITITGDEQNPGKIWIEGLTNEKIYALRKAGGGTYKIPAQKAADKSVAEGTVMYDDNSKQINICVGCKYMDANPADAFTKLENTNTNKNNKTPKTTVINFTGSKTDGGTAKLN